MSGHKDMKNRLGLWRSNGDNQQCWLRLDCNAVDMTSLCMLGSIRLVIREGTYLFWMENDTQLQY